MAVHYAAKLATQSNAARTWIYQAPEPLYAMSNNEFYLKKNE
jgi:hypothetical protein